MENFRVYRKSDMVSLYDYYGKAQGMERGLEVYGMAMEDCVHTDHRQVDQGGYQGRVRTYPRSWLDKIVFIDLAHQTGVISDDALVTKLTQKYNKQLSSMLSSDKKTILKG